MGGCRRIRALIWATPVVLLAPFSVPAWTIESSVTDASGGWCSNATFASVSSGGQLQPVGVSTGAAFTSYGGFMYAFVLHPTNDHDGDAIADEMDMDDDNDGLPDHDELTGAAFDPSTITDPFAADSDGDGVSDADEARAGTNPKDAASRFEVVGVSLTGSTVYVSWRGREGLSYHVVAITNVCVPEPPQVLGTVTAVNGSGPWQETESAAVVPLTTPEARFLYIQKPGE